jgi:acetolactate synthase-1/2/3 large subunit
MGHLADLGVRQAFMVTGGGAMHLNDAIGAQHRFEVVCTLHEQGAAIAAEAFAKQSGYPALCLVTAGPGGTNAITGVASAWLDSVPMLVISGQVKRQDLVGSTGVRQRGVQEMDIVSMIRGITKSAVTLMDPEDVRYEVERALHLATTGRRGPVWIDIPLDLQGAPINPETLRPFMSEDEPTTPRDDPSDSANLVAAMIRESRRPLILVGAGVRLAGAHGAALELAEQTGIPTLSTWPAQGVLGDDHPLYVGRPGTLAPRGSNFALQAADFILCLGARLDLITTGYDPKDFGRNARKVVVEIDPAELAKLDGAFEFGHLGDVGPFIAALSSVVREANSPAWHDEECWVERCRNWKDRYSVVTASHREPSATISTYHFAEVISDVARKDDVMAFGCSGLGIEIFILALRLHTGQRAIFGNGLGAMGCGPPTALGACLAAERRRTICIDGDGGLQLNIQELETIRRLHLPIKLFVLSNNGYASIRASQQRWFGRVIGADPSSGITLPPLDELAQAYGWSYGRLDGTNPLAEQVETVLAIDGPVLCEVPTPQDEARQPFQGNEVMPDGSIRSLPFEDLSPRLDRSEFAFNVLGPNGRLPELPADWR